MLGLVWGEKEGLFSILCLKVHVGVNPYYNLNKRGMTLKRIETLGTELQLFSRDPLRKQAGNINTPSLVSALISLHCSIISEFK